MLTARRNGRAEGKPEEKIDEPRDSSELRKTPKY